MTIANAKLRGQKAARMSAAKTARKTADSCNAQLHLGVPEGTVRGIRFRQVIVDEPRSVKVEERVDDERSRVLGEELWVEHVSTENS